ncbi:MAG: aminotransferase class V-fold PLP-dependent enzyme [Crocinitomicaceae bacterium]|nr:aminotransferase class V-fold PLP-dependent enzyme [Flavobacteriales bacterium]NQZ34916.1 aminotransferase class V-fold PLP-dependent enzyme [Crocinitomicaceae bacterium]
MLKNDFLLNPEFRHLNHGSFGACPRPIFEDYQYWQLRLEQDPVQFFVHDGNKQLEISKLALAKYINCDADDLVMTMNPSYAINIVAKSFNLEAGDEILSTDHEYGAMDRTWSYYCQKAGATYIQQEIPLGLKSKEEIIEEFWKGYSHRTKAIFISQITSMTATIFPVKEICERAKQLGLITIIDGAHVPGHIPLDLSKLKADIYTGACHKWMLAPKGCSFLYITKEFQNNFDPLLISWGFEADVPGKSKFLDYHQLQGTRDYAAFLTLPKAIEYLNSNNWWDVSKRCKQLILDNYEDLCDIAGTKPITAVNSDFLGQICSVPVPISDPNELKSLLYEKYKIEIPVFQWKDQIFMRLSAQAYVEQEDIDYLKKALIESRSTINSWKSA